MSKAAAKVRCAQLTRAGRPCRGWAVRGSDPPTCPSHLSARSGARAQGQARPIDLGTRSPREVPAEEEAAERAGSGAATATGQVSANRQPEVPGEPVRSFYTPALSRQELADLLAYAAEMTLGDEIACARAALRRTLEFLSQGPDAVSESHYLRAVGLVLQGTRTIAQLLRDQQAMGGSVSDQLRAIFDAALDELSEEWGIEL
jgi:hypothetical protein